MAENSLERAPGVPTEAERARVEMTAFLLRRRPAAQGAGGYPPSPGLYCTHEGPDGRQAHIVAVGPATSRLISAFILAPFVGADDACELAPAFAEHFFPEGGEPRTAIIGIEVYNWLAQAGIVADPPPEWHWQSVETFAQHMIDDILVFIGAPRPAAVNKDDAKQAPDIPF